MTKVFDRDKIRDWTIYLITNPIGQKYVGSTCNFSSRMSRYKNGHCHNQTLLYDSIQLYGYDSHEIKILDTFNSSHEYSKGKEIFWVRSFMANRSVYPEMNGLNKTIGGGVSPHLQSKESRAKTLIKFRENPSILVERGEKISNSKIGHRHSQECKDKIRETKLKQVGRPVLQYSLSGEFIKEFVGVIMAQRETGLSINTILNSVKGRVKNNKKFIFKYK